jgi:hypothetical protein
MLCLSLSANQYHGWVSPLVPEMQERLQDADFVEWVDVKFWADYSVLKMQIL